jgi:O-antigen ligase
MRYRTYSDSLAFFAPFTLAMAGLARTRAAWIWWSIFALQLLLIFFTGVRGAWLGLGIALLVWAFIKFDKKMLGVIAAIGISTAILLTVIMPKNIVMDRMHQGFSTSGRTHGTWGPSYDMMLDKPILGYGWGKSVYHTEFNKRAPKEPTWEFKKSLGPHSNYLEIGFAAGLVGLLSLILLYAKAFASLLDLSRRSAMHHTSYFALATLCAFTAQYLVRGFVESSRWQPLGLLLGIAVALLLSSQHLTAGKLRLEAEKHR